MTDESDRTRPMTEPAVIEPWEIPQAAPARGVVEPWDVAQRVQMLEQPHVNAPGGILNSIIANLQASSGGLMVRGKAPDTVMSEDAAWYERAFGTAAGLVGDIPGILVGGAIGGGPASPVTAAAGAFAVPSAIREALMTAYEGGAVDTWEEVWEITKAGVIGGGKGAVIGAATGGAGKFVRGLGGGVVARTGAEVTALVGTGSALEGRMPTAQDFLDAAIVVGGLHGVAATVGRIRNIYAKTGIPPEQVAMDAMKDPALKAELAKSGEVPTKYQELAAAENAKAAVPELQDRATAVKFMEKPFIEPKDLQSEITLPKFDYINNPAELQSAVARTIELYGDKIQAQRRGTVSHEQSLLEAKQKLADILGTTGERLPGTAGNQAEIMARAFIAERAYVDLMQKGKAISELGANATGEQVTQFLAQTERTAMIFSEFMGVRAEAGRALEMLKSTSKLTKKLEQMTEVIESYGGRERITEFARVASEADSPAAAGRAARKYSDPTVLEKVIEAWKASILSGPTTHMANLTGNISSLSMTIPERALAGFIGRVRGSAAGERVELVETHALITGMSRGVMDGLKMAREVLAGREPLSEKVDVKRPQGAIKGTAGKVIRTPFRALSAEDVFFRTMAERGEMYALAVRQAYKEKLAPQTREFNTRVEDLVQNPTEKMLETSLAAGDKAVFTNKLGKMGVALQRMTRGTPLEFVMPFIRTPVNLVKWAAERIPGVNLLMESARSDLAGKNGKVAQDLAIARTIVGGVVATIVVAAVKDGGITGGGISDPDKRRAMMAAGWQPYSIKIGDSYYSYERLDPLGLMVGAAADMAEITLAANEDSSKIDMYGTIVAAIGNATISKTYLSGLSNLVSAVTDPQRYGGRFLDQYAASLIPAALGQTAAAMDPHTREINSIFDAIQGRIPIWREQLLPKRNLLTGQPVEPERLFPMAPVAVTRESKDKVLTEAARMGIRLPIAPKKVHVGRGTGKIGDVEITPEARNAYTQKQGEFAHDLLARIVGSEGWDRIPDIVKEGIYSKVLRGARQQAALVALPPEARAVEIQRIANEMAAQLTR
ncbi:MAG: hypothetical protein NUV55_04750 [Sulfuricaulis sp.]|uniref:hypothetical protein n=1 Tax=Sulfuricaulis sp. TaxID=2003553 RepID=UPI0025F57801|nr:hypothetical protein [Sulfuricaulis sp.]MCR4346496.1 hypothetical protein [Sulfuricaulis sp.]